MLLITLYYIFETLTWRFMSRTERDGNGFHENTFRWRAFSRKLYFVFATAVELSAFHPATGNIDVYDKTRFRGVAGKTSLEKHSLGWRATWVVINCDKAQTRQSVYSIRCIYSRLSQPRIRERSLVCIGVHSHTKYTYTIYIYFFCTCIYVCNTLPVCGSMDYGSRGREVAFSRTYRISISRELETCSRARVPWSCNFIATWPETRTSEIAADPRSIR